METKNKSQIGFITVLLSMLLMIQSSYASLSLDLIQFDPAIITAGDEVDIIVQFRDESSSFITEDKIANPDYTFKVRVLPDDDVTKKYVTILDSYGDNIFGNTLYSNQIYNKKFRIKVSPNAPTGNYEFKLVGEWYKNGVKTQVSRELKFLMNVKKEGIILELSSLTTTPSQIRPGDDFVEIKTYIENLGEKDAKAITLQLEGTDTIKSSYSNNNQIKIGRLNAGESKEITFFVNIDEETQPGVHTLNYQTNYRDLDNNQYTKNDSIEVLIKPKSNLVVEKVEGEGLAGDSGTLKVYIKNSGSQKAENIDVRILKQNSQPFEFDVRSDYIGTLNVNQTGVAIFNFKITSDAEIKTHDFNLLLRAKGDSSEGDDTIYTFHRNAPFTVTGKKENIFLQIGSIAVGLFIAMIVIRKIKKGGKKNEHRK
jgi:hypothetical protein